MQPWRNLIKALSFLCTANQTTRILTSEIPLASIPFDGSCPHLLMSRERLCEEMGEILQRNSATDVLISNLLLKLDVLCSSNSPVRNSSIAILRLRELRLKIAWF